MRGPVSPHCGGATGDRHLPDDGQMGVVPLNEAVLSWCLYSISFTLEVCININVCFVPTVPYILFIVLPVKHSAFV